jgi:integrase/recombinase XerD
MVEMVISETENAVALTGPQGLAVPVLIAGAGRQAEKRFVEFFTAQIRNPNTRAAYGRAIVRFLDWCAEVGVAQLHDIEPVVVAAYIEKQPAAPQTVKQHLAAIRMLFDYLVIGQVLAYNPAAAVKGPRHSVRTGKTPVLCADEMGALFDAIDTDTLVGLRDRALIGLMVFSFARVSAAVGMKVKDYYHQGKRSFFRLHEKGGVYNVVPAHHKAMAFLDEYIEAAGIGEERDLPLFRSSGRGRGRDTLTERPLTRSMALKMVKRRAKDAGFGEEVCNHSFRGTGITDYLRNSGTLEIAARIAGHASTRTTQLYDRRHDDISLDEIERIHI